MIMWYLKQLLPLHYCTMVRRNDQPVFIRWRMRFGRCFHVIETS